MKILFLTDQVYLHGGVEKVLAKKINYLVDIYGYEVFLITSEQKGNAYCYPISNKANHLDLAINYVRTKSYFSLINLIKIPKHILNLRKNLKELKPDVLVVCNYAFDFYFIPFISKEIKTVKEFHSSRYYYIKELPNTSPLNKTMYKLNNWVETKYCNLVVLNQNERNYYKSNNVVVIPNAAIDIGTEKLEKRKNLYDT